MAALCNRAGHYIFVLYFLLLYGRPMEWGRPFYFHPVVSSFFLSLWPPYVIGQAIIFLPCGIFFLSIYQSSFFSSPNLSGRRVDVYVPYFYTWCGLIANLGCRSEMRCRRLAANTGRKKTPSRHHRSNSSGHIFATKACMDNLHVLIIWWTSAH